MERDLKSGSASQHKYPRHLASIARLLSQRYGDFDHFNKTDPVDELFFIICSTQTDEDNYRLAFERLKAEFPTHEQLASASRNRISRSIKVGGLYNQKSKIIRDIIDSITSRFGSLTLQPLHALKDEEAEEFLLSLPGVGKKIARCVLLYSLGRNVFPVDIHCWRISRRMGWVRETYKDGRCSARDMERLQKKIPTIMRFTLHVNLVSLGRELCTAHEPKCHKCPVRKYCKRIGVGKGRKRSAIKEAG